MEKITDKIAALPEGESWFSLEFFPPKTQAGFTNLLPRLTRLARLRPLFVTVTWGAGGSTATKSLDLAEICQQQLGLTTCLHLTCTNMPKKTLDRALSRAKELGIRNLLALRGDEPREHEYGPPNGTSQDLDDVDSVGVKFTYAIDLVKYIRQEHGDWFCIGVAAYPEGHATSPYDLNQSPENDFPNLVAKTRAGADFLMTQLFYDVDAYIKFRNTLKEKDTEGILNGKIIIPGLMPVQSWGILTRTTKLCCVKAPQGVWSKLEKVKGDDAAVKELGVDVLQDIIKQMRSANSTLPSESRQGFHFYTLNLERAVAQILERCDLIRESDAIPTISAPPAAGQLSMSSANHQRLPSQGGVDGRHDQGQRKLSSNPRRRSSANAPPENWVIVDRLQHIKEPRDDSAVSFEVSEDEIRQIRPNETTKKESLAVSEGEGSLGHDANWDDYPNGRFGDARSPAYGAIDGYGPTIHFPPTKARELWGQPTKNPDVTSVFRKYLMNEIPGLPWSEEALNAETALIRKPLVALTEKGFWTIASQPAVDACISADDVVGWGPKCGGWVWQKPFVEFFLPSTQWQALKSRLDKDYVPNDDVSYFAANVNGDFFSSFTSKTGSEEGVNPVTWGAFKGKEIITPTLIDHLSFRAWQEEAFEIWREWQHVYPPNSPSAQFLNQLRGDVWLVNVVGHNFKSGKWRRTGSHVEEGWDEKGLWEILIDA